MNGVISLNRPIRLEVDQLAMWLTITGEQDEAKTLDTVRRLWVETSAACANP